MAYIFAREPEIIDGICKWTGVEVRKTDRKGFGLFATMDLQSNLCYPYGGIPTVKSRVNTLGKRSGEKTIEGEPHEYVDYLCKTGEKDSTGEDIYLDAHHRHLSDEWKGSFCWIGSLANEPSENETANACLMSLIERDYIMPDYPNIDKNYAAWICLTRDIKEGEEIMTIYGWSAKTYKRLGYKVGCNPTELVQQSVVDEEVGPSEKKSRKEITAENFAKYFNK